MKSQRLGRNWREYRTLMNVNLSVFEQQHRCAARLAAQPRVRLCTPFRIPPNPSQNLPYPRRQAFTLIEVLVAMALMVSASLMTYLTFGSVSTAWRRGNAVAEDLHHGDFIMDQLVAALRSAYYPDAGGQIVEYGFWWKDQGSGDRASDSISWVKRGSALSGPKSAPDVPHRVEFGIYTGDRSQPAAGARYWWLPYAQAEDFSADKVEPVILSSRVRGFDCRVSTNLTDDGWEWDIKWEDDDTNRLPKAVELTLYLDPMEPGEPSVELKRYVQIPVAHLSR
jgi:prepilin-type N-terminal cleavage/methylation domain-containing protein